MILCKYYYGMRKRTTSQVICQNFKIPAQTIFQDYKCTYRSSVLFFGRLYVGQEHILFIANMFGLVKKCCISIDSISKIESQDSSLITVCEKVDGLQVEYVFGSFKSSNAYLLMKALWKGEQIGSDIFKNQNEQETEQHSMLPQPTDKMDIQQGYVQANFFNPQVVDAEKQKIVQVQFPCSVQQFYDFFLADSATVYPRKKHLENRGGRDIQVTQWRKSEQLNSEVRQINAMLKVTGIPFLKEAGMSQVWMLKQQEDCLKLNIVTQMADVPYAAYFNCEEHIVISKDGDKKCKMVIQLAIVFNKSTYMKGTILARTFADLKQEYQFWIKNVKAILQQTKKKKEQAQQVTTSKDVEYESSEPHSEKLIPAPKDLSPRKKNLPTLLKVKYINSLTLEQKVDLTLKLMIVLVALNIVLVIQGFF